MEGKCNAPQGQAQIQADENYGTLRSAGGTQLRVLLPRAAALTDAMRRDIWDYSSNT